MTDKKYWLEALEFALDIAGLFGTIPNEKLEEMASCLSDAAEEKKCFFQYTPKANTLQDEEIKELKRQLKEAEKKYDKMKSSYEQNVASRHNVSVSQVYIDEYGDAYFRR